MSNSGIDHEHSAAIDQASAWLSQTSRDRLGKPIIPALRERFGLSLAEACDVCRQANLRRQRAA
jgi:hypothetical protein